MAIINSKVKRKYYFLPSISFRTILTVTLLDKRLRNRVIVIDA